MKLQVESAKKRDKVNEELQTQMRERDEVDRRGGWFMRATLLGKMDRQIERTAQLQSQAVEELARRSHQAAVAKQRTAEGSHELRKMLIEADIRLKKVLGPLLHGCAHAWQDAADSIHSIGQKLQVDAESLSAFEGDVAEGDAISVTNDGSESCWGIDHHTIEDAANGGAERLEAALLGRSNTIRSAQVEARVEEARVEDALARPVVSLVAQRARVDAMPRQTEDCTRSSLGQDPWLGQVLQQAKPLSTSGASPNAEPRPAHFRIGGGEDSQSESSMSYHSSEEDVCTAAFSDAVAAPLTSMSSSGHQDVAEPHDAFVLQSAVHTRTLETARQNANLEDARCLEFVADLPQSPLGLKLSWPPGKVEVLAIVKGGWADLAGIWEGAEIVKVNSEPVSNMQEAALKELLRLRPLRVAVAPRKREVAGVAPAPAVSEMPSSSLQAGSIQGCSISGPVGGAFGSARAFSDQILSDRV